MALGTIARRRRDQVAAAGAVAYLFAAFTHGLAFLASPRRWSPGSTARSPRRWGWAP